MQKCPPPVFMHGRGPMAATIDASEKRPTKYYITARPMCVERKPAPKFSESNSHSLLNQP